MFKNFISLKLKKKIQVIKLKTFFFECFITSGFILLLLFIIEYL